MTNKNNWFKNLFEKIQNEAFEDFCKEIAQQAKEETQASFSFLFLTTDHKILEAIAGAGKRVEKLEPLQLPSIDLIGMFHQDMKQFMMVFLLGQPLILRNVR